MVGICDVHDLSEELLQQLVDCPVGYRSGGPPLTITTGPVVQYVKKRLKVEEADGASLVRAGDLPRGGDPHCSGRGDRRLGRTSVPRIHDLKCRVGSDLVEREMQLGVDVDALLEGSERKEVLAPQRNHNLHRRVAVQVREQTEEVVNEG